MLVLVNFTFWSTREIKDNNDLKICYRIKWTVLITVLINARFIVTVGLLQVLFALNSIK